ncbi:MAG: cell division protein FtsQ [Breznakibacter sp.]
MKRFVKILVWTLIGLYVPVMWSFVLISNKNRTCRGVSVQIKDSVELQFMTSKEVKNYVYSHIKGLTKKTIKDINLEEVEHLVDKYPSVAKSEAYFTPQGVLRVVVSQRQPVLRVFSDGGTFLLDKEGVKIPLRGSYTKRLMVVTGNIDKLKDRTDLVKLDGFIKDDSFWRAQIEQIHINSQGDIILVPRVGDHYINIGDVNDLEYKFRNLLALYQKGLRPLEWNSYKEINLKYKGQVICTKI